MEAPLPAREGGPGRRSYSRRQRERAALAERSTNFLPYSICASKIGASGVSLAHLVADACISIACLATFSLVSIYQAANFFAPSTVNTLLMPLRPSNIFPFSFSAIAASPGCRRDSCPPVGLLTSVIEIVLAAAPTASAIFRDATLPLNPFSVRFLGRLRGGLVSSLIARTQPTGDFGP